MLFFLPASYTSIRVIAVLMLSFQKTNNKFPFQLKSPYLHFDITMILQGKYEQIMKGL